MQRRPAAAGLAATAPGVLSPIAPLPLLDTVGKLRPSTTVGFLRPFSTLLLSTTLLFPSVSSFPTGKNYYGLCSALYSTFQKLRGPVARPPACPPALPTSLRRSPAPLRAQKKFQLVFQLTRRAVLQHLRGLEKRGKGEGGRERAAVV